MCRGFQRSKEREPLKIKAFHVNLSVSTSSSSSLLGIKKPAFLYDSLTLHFLPRINGASLEIEGLSLRPDTPGFITLHPLVSSSAAAHHHEYGSRERVRVSEGSRFEIYASDDVKLLKGTFRKDGDRDDEDQRGGVDDSKWKLDCRCQLELEEDSHLLREAEVCVEVEGRVAGSVISEKVEMVVLPRRRGRRYCFEWLEEIPEEREVDESDGGCCCCCSPGAGKAGRDDGGGDCWDCQMDGSTSTDTLTVAGGGGGGGGGYWAAVEDVGIWIMCLGGAAYLLSKASSSRILTRRQTRLLFFNKLKY